MHTHTPPQWTRDALERHSLDLRQFIDFRASTLPNGTRIVDAYNASGLHFTLLPDRGLDLWTAHYKGVPLTWISPGSPHPPDYGQRWLALFNGGLLTTCGLTHVGPPETDALTGEVRDLHGEYTRLRAQDIGISGGWDTSGHYHLELRGSVYQSALFGVQFRLERAVKISLTEPALSLSDSITNLGDQPAPLMLLYHINLGYPLIQADTRLHTAHAQVYPRDHNARAGYTDWAVYAGATPGYAEQVYFHHVHVGQDGHSHLLLTQPDDGLALHLDWDAAALPYLTQWKNTRQGIYVCGIEPGNCIPEGQNTARDAGRLQMLQPGEAVSGGWRLSIAEGAAAVGELKSALAALQASGTPAPGCDLRDIQL